MRTLSPKMLLWVWVGGGVVITGVFVWFMLMFFGAKLSDHAKSIEDSLLTVELNRREAQNISTLQKQVAEIQSKAAKLDVAFANRSEALKLVEFFEQLAAKYNLEEDFSPVEPLRNPTTKPGVFTVEDRDFSLSVSGSTTGILQFLRDIEVQPTYLLVGNFSLQKGEEENATLTLAGTIPWH